MKKNEELDETYTQIVCGVKSGGACCVETFPMSYKKVLKILNGYKALMDSAKYTVHKYRKPFSKTDADCPACGTAVENCIHIHMLEKSIEQIES